MSLRIFRREAGQSVVILALTLPVLLGMTGMAVDVGSYASHRRTLQNAADSIALAAAQELPDQQNARDAADLWAARNNIDTSDMQVVVTSLGASPAVRVTIDEPHGFSFVRVIGIFDKDVDASATAIKVSFGGSTGIVPWAVTGNTIDLTPDGEIVIIKYDSNNVTTGNFNPIRLDGSDSTSYETTAMYGSTSAVCADLTLACTVGLCPATYPTTCAENAPECDGPECRPKTGNMTGPTRTAVDFRMNNTMVACDTFAETFSGPDANGQYHVVPDCNPWLDGPGKCDSPTDICSRRVIIIPVVEDFGNGSSDPLLVQEFALMFLEGYDDGACTGNSCEIKARFVNAELTTGGLSGVYDPGAHIQFIRLSE